MRNNWLFPMDLDGADPYVLPTGFFLSHGLGVHLFSQAGHSHFPGSQKLQEAFSCISKFAGALFFWWSSGSSSNLSRTIAGDQRGPKSGSSRSSPQVKHISSSGHNLTEFHFHSRSKAEPTSPVIFGKISSSAIRRMFSEGGIPPSSVLSLAAALITPFDSTSSDMVAVPSDNRNIQMHGCVDQKPCEVESKRSDSLPLVDFYKIRNAVEPRTGIQFPTMLSNTLASDNYRTSEVLVGTGSRTMKIVKIKSLKVYAFGFYVHPPSVCQKLGQKYASISVDQLNKHQNFYEDLLREDIDMTVRLVVNCNGMKINTVKDAFEKSLRARLVKTNPDTDYNCVKKFGSCFTQDIPLPLGTIINFRRTRDGQLITEIGGNQVGAVYSKDLCRAFFDMYIGDVPVSEQTKEEIGRNVASLIRRC